MRNLRSYGLAFTLIALIALALPAPGCMTIAARDEIVRVVDEAAIIVWDANTHTEHFIRRATFHTAARDFGFLVPTPTQPVLAAADDSAFRQLERAMAPERRTEARRRFDWTPLLLRPFFPEPQSTTADMRLMAVPGAMKAEAVRVLDTERVAGYDATVLEADAADALNGWLRDHGYQSGPELTDWLTPYVAAHWKITAFKFERPSSSTDDASESGAIPLSSSAVRLSFQTDRPFYPYREPASQRAVNLPFLPRSLRVFLLGAVRMYGAIGVDASASKWPGVTTWADRLDTSRTAPLARALDLSATALSAAPYMTVMEDSSSPRPGTDEVFFAPATDQGRKVPPPIITYTDVTASLPLDVLTLCIAGPVVLLRTGLKRRARRHAAG